MYIHANPSLFIKYFRSKLFCLSYCYPSWIHISTKETAHLWASGYAYGRTKRVQNQQKYIKATSLSVSTHWCVHSLFPLYTPEINSTILTLLEQVLKFSTFEQIRSVFVFTPRVLRNSKSVSQSRRFVNGAFISKTQARCVRVHYHLQTPEPICTRQIAGASAFTQIDECGSRSEHMPAE